MSRSRRKTPVTGWSCKESEKKDKKMWHSRFRAWWKQYILVDPEYVFSDKDKYYVSNVWDMAKDGKQRLSKDSPWYDILMRK